MTEEHDRTTPLDLSLEEFRAIGYLLIDQLAEMFAGVANRPVTPGRSPGELQAMLGTNRPLPEHGREASELMAQATTLVLNNSLYNAHPRFWGYITAGAAPIGVLGDLLASAVNPNVGGWVLSPMATEIERQTIRWIAELIGFPTECGGILVSGGNMANFVGFLAARASKGDESIRTKGLGIDPNNRFRIYCSAETHTWVQKACDVFGFGTDSVRWIPTDSEMRMKTADLRSRVKQDIDDGDRPLIVIGTAGSVSTGAIDPLPEIHAICCEFGLWFHVDGAYGGLAACVPEVHDDIRGLSLADSVAVDPHKWLYAPLEAGCALVRDPEKLRKTFSYRPKYYHLGDEGINFVEYGMQNSRGFRALKVWLQLQQAGRSGYVRLIREDMELSRLAYERISVHPELEAATNGLSITTFRFVPPSLRASIGDAQTEEYLYSLNEELLVEIEKRGEVFLSPAVLNDRYFLRMCIVNFRTTRADVEALPEIVARTGGEVHARLQRGDTHTPRT